MIGNSSLLDAVLTLVSVASLSMLSLLCLWCKRKSKIIHEENQIYDPQTFQRGGSRFAVMRSKTVTRPNQIPPTTIEAPVEPGQIAQDVNEEQPRYQNFTDAQMGSLEPTYVAPLPMLVYENIVEIETEITDADPSVYENVITSLSINNDDDDYENSDFLDQVVKQEEDDEPDYVNADGAAA
ncbi:linker for activation of T-cells family member 2 [Centroberyx affinis]|uniref:linker for activation of T-cells family member 2 n=1 Tax=Centroberyx affinis TaxID=166261 RepID=UPI003A5C083B